jgi:hypothetical protein
VKSVLAIENKETIYETTVRKATKDPLFNEEFKFNIETCQLNSARLLVFVYSTKLFIKNNLIGCIMFGKIFLFKPF